MSEVVVARHGQITISKQLRRELNIREGDKVIVNRDNGFIVIAKKDSSVWNRLGDFLPDNFEKILEKTRSDSRKRFKEAGII
jgi:AbrB family looped-hinge helix DNA binding protein